MSAELFYIVASIMRRLTNDQGVIPLATRYDDYERTTSAPQPFLFQRHIGQRTEVMTTGSIGEMLRRICKQIAETDPRFEGVHFRPHDFRRFATDLINHGLPIHIGAALLGHLNLETTRQRQCLKKTWCVITKLTCSSAERRDQKTSIGP